ncbi:single-pass membrane and coiled-coil domain-containing protein 3 [Lepisosteus oculatus]|uniref:Single-pass membrane protein with coiled-coil domains 3 n=1 Tax=Lepisosteus oculatus TaxID=7918 RepID=W5NNT3_LEPOC|nr:PREDICTED: single-pass membrane and coiled-coil domain-containing protein 3 [Lepisosteus oculatus]XP_015199541.1 PREDICTED: single-pass membrane and coiled-coil domain-containing protein 3 [Lepisosteus oculatus]XP_015199542.1 PREDICTED: single-pass membrane and coiled-coil domain-containing protein 3 [Lepisosteus oculatus]XP_015199543.1 PREDICTED: single-pass membrane and coiled-coil domain-containing protein 3 [Lepisosteus oculatus]XP_015199544.1 PREDICTED: single-pass membrane and coiled-c
MSWSDTFFPANPRRREEVVRLSRELLTLMEGNFRATSWLAGLLNQELKISVDQHKSVKENCEALIAAIAGIQSEVARIDERLRDKLEPALYRRLHNLTVPISERVKVASKVFSSAFGILRTGAAAVPLISKGAVLSRMVASLGRIGSSVVSTVALGVLGLGVDMLVSAILGAVERDNLERVIQEYREALADFRPASEQYQANITDVIATVKAMQG